MEKLQKFEELNYLFNSLVDISEEKDDILARVYYKTEGKISSELSIYLLMYNMQLNRNKEKSAFEIKDYVINNLI